MKKLLSFLTLALVLGVRVFAQTSGGPDTYGYEWRNSNATNGPTYSWVEIKGNPGTIMINGLADDNVVGPFNVGFNFPYYWLDATQFWIGSNGYIAFSPIANIASTSIGFPSMPTAFPVNQNHFIAPMMCDLNFDGVGNTGKAYYYSNGSDSLVITFDSVPFYANSSYRGYNTFQVILNATEKSVLYQYKQQEDFWDSGYNNVANPLVTGIENVTGQIGLQVSNSTYPIPSTAVKFYYPAVVTYQVTDIQANSNFNDENGGIFIIKDQPVTPTTYIKNVGNQPISATVQCTTSVFPAGSLSPIPGSTSSEAYSTGLAVGQEVIVTQSTAFTPATSGSFLLRGQLSLTGDASSGNNRAETEMNVVDTSLLGVYLSYDRFESPYDPSLHGISGFGSGNGVGVYFEPPYHPAQIDSIIMFVITTSVPSDFTVELYDDDAAPGQGTSLGVANIPGSALPAQSVVIVPIPINPPIQLLSGGMYVAMIQNGDSTYMITDNQPPFSYRTYEVLGGSWATHRSRSTEDLTVRLAMQPGSGATNVSGDMSATLTALSQNYPNPANGKTTIDYVLANGGNAEFSITNIHGQVMEVRSIDNLNAGSHKIEVDMSNYASGFYFYTLQAGDNKLTRKMTVSH
jgi:hypothetical protein